MPNLQRPNFDRDTSGGWDFATFGVPPTDLTDRPEGAVDAKEAEGREEIF